MASAETPRPQPSSRSAAGLEFDARRLQREATRKILTDRRTPLEVVAVAQSGAQIADDSIERALNVQPPRPRSVCREQCPWCCYKKVGTTEPEVLRIRDYLRGTLSAETLQLTLQRIEELQQARQELRSDPWAASRLPCSLLVDGRCSVYPVRPLTCRGFNSSNARACETAVKSRKAENIPIFQPQLRIATFVLDGTRAGLQESGLPGELLELNAALAIALQVPDAESRWLRGEPVFAPARMH
jgi:Fe-S-cluster containining protein